MKMGKGQEEGLREKRQTHQWTQDQEVLQEDPEEIHQLVENHQEEGSLNQLRVVGSLQNNSSYSIITSDIRKYGN